MAKQRCSNIKDKHAKMIYEHDLVKIPNRRRDGSFDMSTLVEHEVIYRHKLFGYRHDNQFKTLLDLCDKHDATMSSVIELSTRKKDQTILARLSEFFLLADELVFDENT